MQSTMHVTAQRLLHTAPGGDAETARDAGPASPNAPFWAYLAAVVAAGLGLLGLELAHLEPAALTRLATMPELWVVTALVVFGELRPIVTPGATDNTGITVSTTFTVAVLLYVGLPVAAALQAVAMLYTHLARHKAWWRSLFNIAQYTLSLGAAGLVLHLGGVVGSPRSPAVPTAADLGIVGLAAAAYFVVNNGSVWVAIALFDRERLADVIRPDVAYQLVVTGALIGLSPLVVVVMGQRAWLLPLFVLPLLAVYKNASLSRDRDRDALHDGLTGLPNRDLMLRRAQEAVAEARRTDSTLALFLLDLDRFKEVNDTLGHPTGDRLLQVVASRLAGSLRPGDTVARLGGDEFAVLLSSVRDAEAATEVATRTCALLREPFLLDGMELDLEASAGIALFPDHAYDVETLLARADVAMYLAKASRLGVETYAAERDRNSPDRLGLLSDLRRGLEAGEIELHYQPKVSLTDGEVVGTEALVRWRHPSRGLIYPDQFVPLAEQTGLMPRLTRYVLDAAMAQAADWWRLGITVPVAVNVTMRDVQNPALVDLVAAGLVRHDIPASALHLEITEQVLMEEPFRATQTLNGLADLGVRLSLDDFGTGYSSLVHLRRLPVSEVKVDRSFVHRMHADEDDAAIVRSIVDLAKALGLRTVAEGVETQETWVSLRDAGCDAAQGWLVSHPLPAEHATTWLADRLPRLPTLRLVAEQA